MRRVYSHGRIEIWEIKETHGADFYVYAGKTLLRVCPSIGMARELAAGQE